MKIFKLFATFLLFSYIGLVASTGFFNPAKTLLTEVQRAKIESKFSEITNEEVEDTADWIIVDELPPHTRDFSRELGGFYCIYL